MNDVGCMEALQFAFFVGLGWRLGSYFGQTIIEMILYKFKEGTKDAPTGTTGKRP